MMPYLRLLWAQIRRILVQPKVLLGILAVPMLTILITLYTSNSDDQMKAIALVRSENPVFQNLEEVLGDQVQWYDSSEKAEEDLKDMKIKAYYENQGDQLLRKSYENSELLINLDRYLQGLIQDAKIAQLAVKMGYGDYREVGQSNVQLQLNKKNTVDFKFVAIFNMMIYAIMLYSVSLSSDMIKMQKNGVLARAITTPPSFFAIQSSYAFANFLVMMVIYTLFFSVLGSFLKFENVNMGIWLLAVGLASFFSISLSMASVRLVKNESLITVVPLFVALVGLLSGIYVYFDLMNLPVIVKMLARVLPNYYLLDMVFTGRWQLNALILFLMSLAVLSLGSYRLDRYARR